MLWDSRGAVVEWCRRRDLEDAAQNRFGHIENISCLSDRQLKRMLADLPVDLDHPSDQNEKEPSDQKERTV